MAVVYHFYKILMLRIKIINNHFWVLVLFLNALTIASCSRPKVYSDLNKPINLENALSIKIVIKKDSNICIDITQMNEVKELINDLNNAPVHGIWKGATWDKITVYFKHDTCEFSTNGKVFGSGSSGTFYTLNNKYHYLWQNLK